MLWSMEVDTCMLCDAATVREGLLHILGGGITQTGRPEFPSPLGMSLALRVIMHPTELAHSHQLEVILQDEDGERVTKFDIQLAGLDPENVPAGQHAPLAIAWDFPGRPDLPHPGRYSFELLIDGVHQRTVPLNAVLIEPEGGDEE
jgi:hypothetical protein